MGNCDVKWQNLRVTDILLKQMLESTWMESLHNSKSEGEGKVQHYLGMQRGAGTWTYLAMKFQTLSAYTKSCGLLLENPVVLTWKVSKGLCLHSLSQ